MTIPLFQTVPPAEITNALNSLVINTNAAVAAAGTGSSIGLFSPPLSTNFPVEISPASTPKEQIVDDAALGLVMQGLSKSTTDQLWSRSRAIVNTNSWTFVAKIDFSSPASQFYNGGIVVYAAGQTLLTFFGLHTDTPGTTFENALLVSQFNQSGTGFVASQISIPIANKVLWLKIAYDGTNLSFFFNNTRTFSATSIFTVAATTQLGAAPTHLGFSLEVKNNNQLPFSIVCDYFTSTAG